MALLDRDLVMLCEPENEDQRMQRYPLLDLNKLDLCLDKFSFSNTMSSKLNVFSSKGSNDILMMEKKDVTALKKSIAQQI